MTNERFWELNKIRMTFNNEDLRFLTIMDCVSYNFGELTEGEFDNLCHIVSDIDNKMTKPIWDICYGLNYFMCEENIGVNDLYNYPMDELIDNISLTTRDY